MSQLQAEDTRRGFLQKLALATGAVVLVPWVTACESAPDAKPDATPGEPTSMPASAPAAAAAASAEAIPAERPAGWDAMAYNRARGAAGAIPAAYMKDINGPDGDSKHLGKHLPYVPKAAAELTPAGFVAIMWGDPDKGHAKHPNAPRSADLPEGHWYNWIRVRKATSGEAQELQSEYPDWPGTPEQVGAKYAVYGGGDLTADGGKNTVYLAALPPDVKPGDTLRIHAHCLTHGEYVDFLTLA